MEHLGTQGAVPLALNEKLLVPTLWLETYAVCVSSRDQRIKCRMLRDGEQCRPRRIDIPMTVLSRAYARPRPWAVARELDIPRAGLIRLAKSLKPPARLVEPRQLRFFRLGGTVRNHAAVEADAATQGTTGPTATDLSTVTGSPLSARRAGSNRRATRAP